MAMAMANEHIQEVGFEGQERLIRLGSRAKEAALLRCFD